jgi:hypothetical protein
MYGHERTIGMGYDPSNSPAKAPLGAVFESDECTNYCPVTGPSLYLVPIQRTLPERFEGRVRGQEKGKPPSTKMVSRAYIESKKK